jgi:hypothetical protein
MSSLSNFFHSTHATPGIPMQQFVTPLVRVNGHEQEMKHGMKIDPNFIPNTNTPAPTNSIVAPKMHWVVQDGDVAEEGMLVEIFPTTGVIPLHFKIVDVPAGAIATYQTIINRTLSYSGGEWSFDVSDAAILNSVNFGPNEWLLALSTPQDVNSNYVLNAAVTIYLLVNGVRAGYIRVSPSYITEDGTIRALYNFAPFVFLPA